MPAKQTNSTSPRLLFFDKNHRFVSPKDRFTKSVAKVYISAPGKGRGYVPLTLEAKGKLTYKRLAFLVRSAVGDRRAQAVVEKLPPVLIPKGEFRPHGNAKYKAWNLAGRIAATRGIVGKLIKVTMWIKDGNSLRPVEFYHSVQKGKGSVQYQLWSRMNEAIGKEDAAFYKQFRGKIISDRKGKRKVDLIGADLEFVL